MPSKKQYDLVSDDGYDSRIPLHNDDAFHHGISFPTKYIGSLDVPRPSSRVEIVAAMRRIRYEFKAKAIKKKKVTISVSVDGLSIAMRKKRKKKLSREEQQRLTIMQHPIYRVFYVSHDSQDLKIFSYIARDGTTNMFRCNVFKAYKKSEAMRIVRTVGQAFEVCHKLSLSAQNENNEATVVEKSTEEENNKNNLSSPEKVPSLEHSPSHVSTLQRAGSMNGSGGMSPGKRPSSSGAPSDTFTPSLQSPHSGGIITSPGNGMIANGKVLNHTQSISGYNSPVLSPQYDPSSQESLTLTTQHQIQYYKQRLEQQTQQTQITQAQVQMLQQQLAAEANARMEAQTRGEQLLIQNRDLLEHINTLVGQLQVLEQRIAVDMTSPTHRIPRLGQISYHQQSRPVSLPTGTTSPRTTSSPLHMERFGPKSPGGTFLLSPQNNAAQDGRGTDITADSPDSGHREMSSDSLSAAAANLSAVTSPESAWYVPTTGKTRTPLISNVVSSSRENDELSNKTSTVDLTLPLRNPFCAQSPTHQSTDDKTVITPLPSQDATGNRLELNFAPTSVTAGANTSPGDANLPPRLDPPPKIPRSMSRLRGITSETSNPDVTVQNSATHNRVCRTSTGGSSSANSCTDSELSFSDGCSSKTSSPPDVNGNQKNVIVNNNVSTEQKQNDTNNRKAYNTLNHTKGKLITSNGPFTGLNTVSLTNANDNTNNNHGLHRMSHLSTEVSDENSSSDEDDDELEADLGSVGRPTSREALQKANMAALDRLLMEDCDVLKQSTSYQNTGRLSGEFDNNNKR